MGTVSKIGLMAKNIKDNGLKEKCMATVNFNSQKMKVTQVNSDSVYHGVLE